MTKRLSLLFSLALAAILAAAGCRDKALDDGTPLFSKGVTKVFGAERILECKARLEVTRYEYRVATIAGHSDELGDFTALAVFNSDADAPALDKNKLYDVVIHQNYREPFDNSIDNHRTPKIIHEDGSETIQRTIDWNNIILIIKDGENVLLNRSICSLHKCAMDFVQVKIQYGLPGPELNRLYETAAKRFPNGLDFTLGGCVVMPGYSPIAERKFVCQKCASEYHKWQQEEYEKKRKN